ncbi:hypothetical protein CNN82_12630 [Pseudomonas frederiksbergensis]|uniref:Uncharacterized protein n=1 Tax=Pseudomonas frederiksbergensis TaxID=104087 RepID=A0AB33E9Q2_9PSED|nr:hypothetical protein CNN82_12630 [Pseudomonas frederiksbergensis]
MVDALLLCEGARRSAATEQSDVTTQNARRRLGREILVGIRGRTQLISDGTVVKQATSAARYLGYRAPIDLACTLKFPQLQPLRTAWNPQVTATGIIFS